MVGVVGSNPIVPTSLKGNRMQLSEALKKYSLIAQCGPIKTRLQFDYGIDVPASDLIEQEQESILRDIFVQDIMSAQAESTPIIIPAITFRASRNHLPKDRSVKQVNEASVAFIVALQKEYYSSEVPVITTAPLGPMSDAYGVDTTPSIEASKRYHQEQLSILQYTEVDFIEAITLPSLNEALGIALAAEDMDKEFVIGFVLSQDGLLLDGTTLGEAINRVDEACQKKKPLGYMIYCTHPSAVKKINPTVDLCQRLIGLKANASSLPLSQLDNLNEPQADEPDGFADDLAELKARFGLSVIGGCCGTSVEHLRAILEKCA